MFRRLVSSTPMVKVFINDIPVQVAQGSSVIQACEAAGVDIPRFCYHEKLSVAGNCRMCLVELEKSPKPIASCAWPVMPDMKVKTDTPLVKKAREGVMEFLLANHPLDCPICDQGGECDLQDQSVRYGSDRSRFTEEKRATANKNLGPLVKTVMTRCIHCTRCVRFANQVAGSVDLGTSGRGNDMEIGTYVEKTLSSEMSGNIIDLCPVGALTSKPYAFTARPWELKKTPSIDVLDAVGSNIRVDSRGQKVMRILPRRNDDINDEWISDKTRFSYDGLTNQRLTSPMINRNGSFEPCTWQEALEYISSNLKTVSANEIGGIAGQLADAESLLALLDFVHMQNSENLMLDTNHSTPSGLVSFSSNFILNSTINGIDEADCILLVGTNPRHDAAIINTRIRKSYLDNNLEVGLIGKLPNLNYQVDHIGESPSDIESLCNGKHPFAKKLMNAKRPLILVSSNVLESKNCLSKIARLIKKLPASANEDWAIFNLLQKYASNTAAFEMGYTSTPVNIKDLKFVYLLNADENIELIPKDAFVVYQGHHGDNGANRANVILPGCAYTEKSATYLNTEGRAQMTTKAVSAPAGARLDWKIIRALSQVHGTPLPYSDSDQIQSRMAQFSSRLVKLNTVHELQFTKEALLNLSNIKDTEVPFGEMEDFYQTNVISRASSTMAKCSKAFTHNEPLAEEAELC